MTIDARVEEERIAQLFARSPTALAVVAVNASILGFLLTREHPVAWVVGWVAVLVLISFGRAIQLVRFRSADDPDPKTWERRFAIGSTLNGLGWGAGGVLFLSDDFPLTVALIFVIGGMVAGASASTAPSRSAFLGFALPAALPLIGHLAWFGDGVHLLMAFMLLLFVAAMSVLARQSGAALIDAMRLRFENADLAEELTSSARQHGRRMRYLLDRAGVALLVADARSLAIIDTSENVSSLLGIDDVGDTLDALPIDLDGVSWQAEVEHAQAREHGVVLRGRGKHCPELEVVLTVQELDAEQLALLVIKDATDQRRLETQVARTAMMASLGTLASGVAHEINNPLTYVLGNLTEVQRWSREHGAPDTIDRILSETLEGARHIEEIVRDLVETSSPRETSVDHTDVADATRRAVRLVASEIEHRAGLDLRIEASGHARVEPSQLLQVVLNLLLNAMQSMPLGQASQNRLSVRVSREGDEATITVADTGCGMDAATRDRIFEPFFSTKGIGEGTGLGLSGAHATVTAAGGRIDVESEPNRGSTFFVRLPVTDVEPRAPSSPRPDPGPSGLRILLIDDDRRVARAIMRLLGEHDVEWVQGGRQALERVEETWDLILCDLMMPEMSGPEFHRRVRELRPELLPHIVFVTGGAFSDEATRFLQTEQPRVIYKPFGSDQLLQLLAEPIP